MGRVIAIVVLFSSLVLVAAFTGGIASHFVERRMRRRAKMPDHELKNHIVICNWNDKGIPIIEEVHADIVREKRPVVIISDDVDAAALPAKEDMPQFEDVYLVKGDPAKGAVYIPAWYNVSEPLNPIDRRNRQ